MDLFQSINTDDMSGAAKMFITEVDRNFLKKNARDLGLDTQFINEVIRESYIDIDLIITSASHSESDFNRIDTYIGDSFGIHYYGRSPIMLTFGGVLLDDFGQIQKYRLTKLYQDLFRITRVARIGVVPNIEFAKCVVQGPLMNLSLAESSSAEDRINVSFNLLVANFYIFNESNAANTQSSIVFNGNIPEPK